MLCPATALLANLFQTKLTRLAWIGFHLDKFGLFFQHGISLLRHEITHNQYNAPSGSVERQLEGGHVASVGKDLSMHFVV